MNESRQYNLPFTELVDKLTIDQLKEFLLNSSLYETEISQLEHDIDLILGNTDSLCNARVIRLAILIAQINTLIWTYKDLMSKADETEYLRLLKLSHQVNGIKNQIKNKLTYTMNDSESSIKTNVSTDEFPFHISV